jgi:hypothetical protein
VAPNLRSMKQSRKRGSTLFSRSDHAESLTQLN